jgi:ELWxxDGT repeat protein
MWNGLLLRRLVLAVFLFGVVPPLAAQGPELVKDLAHGPAFLAGSGASLPVRLHGRDYFGANDGFLGYELWSTDGTPGGTRLFADLCPGRCAGNPILLTVVGDHLFFVAGNTTLGGSFWVWRSDGTVEGTFPLVDLAIPGFGASLPLSYFGPYGNGVVFLVHERDREAWGLWVSDGTRAGTRQIAPLPGRFDGDLPTDFDWPRAEDAPGIHYFRWRDRLWATDGTAEGTHPLATPVVPCGQSWARLERLAIYAGEVERQNCEPWVSDGTSRGTHRLRDLVPGIEPSFPEDFVVAGNQVYFTGFDERGRRRLWKTDGTPRGTVAVRATNLARGLGKAEIVAAVGSRLYFAADDGEHGVELWRTDGNPDSTVLVADLTPGPGASGFSIYGGRSRGRQLFFVAFTGAVGTQALFVTEGTAESTLRLAELGTGATAVSVIGSRIYFAGVLGELGDGLGVTDGTVAGTHFFDISRPARSSDPRQLTATTGGLLFTLAPDWGGPEVWRTGGHAQDTEPLVGPVSTPFAGTRLFPGLGGAFYLTSEGWRFGWTDGRTAREILPPGSIGVPVGFTERAGRATFLASLTTSEGGTEVWVWNSDGTPEGTAAVAPAIPRRAPFLKSFWTWAAAPEGGDLRYLVQEFPDNFPDFLSNLWETDGTAAGTHGLARFPVPKAWIVRAFVAAGSNVFALFNEQSPRQALWVSDGTAEGTRAVIVGPGDDRLSFVDNALVAAGDQVFLPVETASAGVELWVSDGTAAGTHPVIDLAPGAASSDPTDLAAFGDRLLFSADDGEHGRELWITDGTSEGTRRLEIHPGPKGSYPQAFRSLGDRAVFAADDGVHGLELWTTDGTPEGTRLAADVQRGPKGSSPQGFEVFGDELFFLAGRPREGYELWKLPLSEVVP